MVALDVTPPAVAITSPTAGRLDRRRHRRDRSRIRRRLRVVLAVLRARARRPRRGPVSLSGTYPVGRGRRRDCWAPSSRRPSRGRTRSGCSRATAPRTRRRRPSRSTSARRSYLERLAVEPRAFSPNGDGRRDADDDRVRAARGGRGHARGAGRVERDRAALRVRRWRTRPERTRPPVGRHGTTQGGPVPDGNLRVHIARAATPRRSSRRPRWPSCWIGTPPTIALTAPVAGTDVTNAAVVHGSIHDGHLVEYVHRGGAPVHAPPSSWRSGNQNVVDADLAALPRPDGRTRSRFGRVRKTRPRTSRRWRVPSRIDSVRAAGAARVAPARGRPRPRHDAGRRDRAARPTTAWIGGSSPFGPGAQPTYFVPIASGTEGGTGLALGNWAVAALPDGTYTLRLVARDRAGQESESRAIVVLDSVAPVAVIGVPARRARAQRGRLRSTARRRTRTSRAGRSRRLRATRRPRSSGRRSRRARRPSRAAASASGRRCLPTACTRCASPRATGPVTCRGRCGR